jgi:Glycosyltransferase family 87
MDESGCGRPALVGCKKNRPGAGSMKRTRIPFGTLTGSEWQNLAISALLALYVIQVALDAIWGNIFSHLSIDFASFWSAGYIANHFGYVQVYDLDLMQRVQAPLWPGTAGAAAGFQVVPTPYLPLFLIAFQPFALLRPILASWIWMALNLLATVFYLRYFARRVSGRGLPPRLLAMLLVSVPVFSNIFVGQVNAWLMICIGQYMLAAERGKPFRAGLWLGGLLLKPQCLVLIVPALVLRRSTRIIAGLSTTSVAVAAASLAMVGSAGLTQIARLWLGYAGGIATNYPELMMNWRMIGLLIAQFGARSIAASITVIGMALTALAALYMWPNSASEDPSRFSLALVGTFAATGLVAWHSHVHMAMILLPPLLYVYLKHRAALGQTLEWWVFLPAAFYVARLMLASLVRTDTLHMGGGELDFLAGSGLFAMNLYLLLFALRRLGRPTMLRVPAA